MNLQEGKFLREHKIMQCTQPGCFYSQHCIRQVGDESPYLCSFHNIAYIVQIIIELLMIVRDYTIINQVT